LNKNSRSTIRKKRPKGLPFNTLAAGTGQSRVETQRKLDLGTDKKNRTIKAGEGTKKASGAIHQLKARQDAAHSNNRQWRIKHRPQF